MQPSHGELATRGRSPALSWTLSATDRRRLARLALDGLTLALTTTVFLILNKPFFASYSGYDEEFFTWGGWCITKGLVPYRDFSDFKPPIVFLTHALAIGLFGAKDFGFRTFFTFAPLAAVLALQASLLARGIERVFTLAVIVGFLCLYLSPHYHDTSLSDCESIAVMYYLLGLAAFLWEGPKARFATALGGFFMSSSVLSKEPAVGVVLATWLGMFWLRGQASCAEAKRFARQSLLGVGIFALLLCLYLVPTGALTAYLHMLRRYPTLYVDPKTSFCVALGRVRGQEGLAGAWRHVHAFFFNLRILGYLLPIALPGAFFAFRRSRWLFATMIAAIVAALWAAVATNCRWAHYCIISMAGVLYVLVVAADSLKGPLAKARSGVRFTTTALAVLATTWALFPGLVHELLADYSRLPWREPERGLLNFIATNTQPSDRIFTTGTPALYVQSDRLGATVENQFLDDLLPSYPGSTDAQRLRPVYEELEKNRPKIVFLDPAHAERRPRHLETLMLPFLLSHEYVAIDPYLFLRR
jgi:hypothetical protein